MVLPLKYRSSILSSSELVCQWARYSEPNCLGRSWKESDCNEKERSLVGKAPGFPDLCFRTHQVRNPGEERARVQGDRKGREMFEPIMTTCHPSFFLSYRENMQLSNILQSIHQENLHSELTQVNHYQGILLSRIARKASLATFSSSGSHLWPTTARKEPSGPWRDSPQ